MTRTRPSRSLALALLAGSLSPALHAAGVLTLLDQERNNLAGVVNLDGPEIAALAPDGRHLYVAGTQDDDILVFARDQVTGELTFIDDTVTIAPIVPAELAGLLVSPDGRFVYASFRTTSRIRWYARDAATGLLTLAGSITEGDPTDEYLTGAGEMVLSPDGTDLYVVAADDAAVSRLDRDPATGALTYRQGLRFELFGIDFMKGASGLALSPDGTSLYVASPISGTLVMYGRRGDGAIGSPAQRVIDQAAGIEKLGGANAVAVSPDGRFVVATAGIDNALVTFKRSPTGFLTRREEIDLGAEPFGVAFNRTGDRLYVSTGDGVTVFSRDVESGGGLTQLGLIQDGVGGVDFLRGGRRPLLSAGNEHLYLVAPEDDAVATIATGDDGALRLRDGRFAVTATFTTNQGTSGPIRLINLSDDTGYAYFTNPANIELVVKVLDGCGINDRYWVFLGGLTNVAVTLTVEDTSTGTIRTYTNPQGTAFVPRQDTAAFATCP